MTSSTVSYTHLDVYKRQVRAMQLLESKIGKDAVVQLIEEGIEKPITFKEYPHDPEYLLELREKINCAIKRA